MVPMQNRADSGRSLNFTAVRELTIDEQHAGQRIDNFLISRLKGLPRTRIYRILRRGEVRVNKGRIRQHSIASDGAVAQAANEATIGTCVDYWRPAGTRVRFICRL